MKLHRLSLFAALVFAVPAIAIAQHGGDKPAQKPAPKPAATKPVEKPMEKPADKVTGAEIGKPAPDFTLKDLNGKDVKLSDYKGKIVVLEWFNPKCPFVVRTHEEGSLKTTAADLTKDGIVWLSINSSGPGKEGNGIEDSKKAAETWKITNPILVDETGRVGMMYGAKTTPHMFVIDAKGMLAYAGAIDNNRGGDLPADKVVNYVKNAVSDLKSPEGKVKEPKTQPYGCGVKYATPAN